VSAVCASRVAIARGSVKNDPILSLDGTTSAPNSEIEAHIQDAIGYLCQGRTVIAIAHRLLTLARMDRIPVMDRAKITERGSHAHLLAAKGTYAAMWQRQSSGFMGESTGLVRERESWQTDFAPEGATTSHPWGGALIARSHAAPTVWRVLPHPHPG